MSEEYIKALIAKEAAELKALFEMAKRDPSGGDGHKDAAI